MDRRTYLAWLKGHNTLQPASKKVTCGKPRHCHTCGALLVRRQHHRLGTHYASKAARTESKQAFMARHFCNAVCRASCRSAALAKVPLLQKNTGRPCPAY